MPRGDRTGPMGMGPMTGRHMGICAGYADPDFMSPGPFYGMGRGLGFGRGFSRGIGFGRGRGLGRTGYGGYMDYPTPSFSREEEVAFLERQAKEIKEEQTLIKTRLEELKKAKE